MSVVWRWTVVALIMAVAAAGLVGCNKKESAATPDSYEIAVFVPGVVTGSPTYEMLVNGVQRAAAKHDYVTVKVVEGGFNQGDWADGVTSLAASKTYDLIVSSNPALPEICARVAEQFPNQRFLVLDGYLDGNPSMHTLLYNQMEQAYLIGHMGGLVTTSDMAGANKDLMVGLIAGQEYPIMNRVIRVGFELGLKRANPEIRMEFRVIGNWYDATKGRELAARLYDLGADVILTIAGGANQGVISEAKERGTYVLWFDSNGYSAGPGVVIGSSALRQEQAAYEKTLEAIEGTLNYGVAEIRGVQDGYVEFITDDPAYQEYVPESLRDEQRALIEEMQSGAFALKMPTF